MPRRCDILMVDDSDVDVQLMQYALLEANLDHNLHVVNDGTSALAFLRREDPYGDAIRPDLVLLDINMPGMTGHEVLDEVKADEDLRSIPVVILTTSSNPDHVLISYKKYANSHVTKPMQFKDLVSKVAEGVNSYWFNVVELPEKSA